MQCKSLLKVSEKCVDVNALPLGQLALQHIQFDGLLIRDNANI